MAKKHKAKAHQATATPKKADPDGFHHEPSKPGIKAAPFARVNMDGVSTQGSLLLSGLLLQEQAAIHHQNPVCHRLLRLRQELHQRGNVFRDGRWQSQDGAR